MVCRFAVQRESSAEAGSPSVNRDVGTTEPVYISSVLPGTSPPGTGGTVEIPVVCADTRVLTVSLLASRWIAQQSQTH